MKDFLGFKCTPRYTCSAKIASRSHSIPWKLTADLDVQVFDLQEMQALTV
jgi:hypothetical protein